MMFQELNPGSPEPHFRYCTLDAAFREWKLLVSSTPKIRPDLTAGGPTERLECNWKPALHFANRAKAQRPKPKGEA